MGREDRDVNRPALTDLSERCQKPDHRRVGNWMACHVTRPLALRLTWLLLPTGLTAHGATLLALLAGIFAAGAFACGGPWGWLAGALLLQAWYLLDHVDGQLARFHGTASLDGVQLDYLMHHTINLLVPLGAGYGLSSKGEPWMLSIGLAWGLGLLWIGLIHDTRYKAFVQRLKRVRGELIVVGGGGGRPAPPPGPPRSPRRLANWLARKSCETHVTMNVLTTLAVVQWFVDPVHRWKMMQTYAIAQAALAILVAAGTAWRGIAEGASEREFAEWYRLAEGRTQRWQDGWLVVDEPAERRRRA
jgi:phosphatidylglycerophosphate synthase